MSQTMTEKKPDRPARSPADIAADQELIPVKIRRGTWRLARLCAAMDERGGGANASDWLARLVAREAKALAGLIGDVVDATAESTVIPKKRGPKKAQDGDGHEGDGDGEE